MQRSKKNELIGELETDFQSSTSLLVADYRGLSVAQLAQVRNDLRFRVVKNTLGRVAAERANVAGVEQLLKGPTAVAFCRADPAPVAKRLSDVARETRLLALRGAVLDGRTYDEEGVRT